MRHTCLALCFLALVAFGVNGAAASPADDIRARLEQWTDDFNAKKIEPVCDLFSRDLLSDVRGQGVANYETRCDLLTKALTDPSRTFHYSAEIHEILVEGDLAIVRLTWTSFLTPLNITTVEPGMDVFRKEPDGVWRIIRYMAYEAP